MTVWLCFLYLSSSWDQQARSSDSSARSTRLQAPSHTIVLVKASHMGEPTSRTGEIYSASLMGRTAKSHIKDIGLGGVKNWGCYYDQ